MDKDSDINAALDTIADFCTQSEEHNDSLFEFKFDGEPNESEVKILKTMLDKWIKLNNFRPRLWYMFRDTIKNGDAFYLRDPETQEWLWLDHFMVEMVKVDESDGKRPEEYLLRGLDYNRQAKYATKKADPNQYRTPFGSNTAGSRVNPVPAGGPAAFSLAGNNADPRQRNNMTGQANQEIAVVDAEHVVHLSLSIGNDINWPFGTSILEPIFKTFKQKELLEDAIIIYRVQRAPERRIFYIDTGTMPPERAKRHIEAIKNDIHQRRIPNRTGGGTSMMDAAYNPLCMSLDTILPLVDGRFLSLTQLIAEYQEGKENWVYSCDPKTGEIMPGPITWAGVTRRDAEVVCVALDNGGAVIVTPDHKFPLLGGDIIHARDLQPHHQLITRERFIRDDGTRTGHGPDNMIVHPLEVITLQDKMDVGTITVDKDEKYHPHHNFAISENIFLCNSINDDYFFAQCSSLNATIALLDGRTLTLAEIISEFEQGRTNYAYSLNRETHELEPGKIAWAGVTRRNAELVRVTLDNDDYVDVTPDHRFIMRDGSEREAGLLRPGDSLMPLYLREGRTGPRQKNAGYMRYVSNADGKTKFVHTTICPKPRGREWVVHHRDFDGNNNNPDNLEVMTWADHESLHKAVGTYSLSKQWNDPEARAKLIKGIAALWDKPESAKRSKAALAINRARSREERRMRASTAGYSSFGDFKRNYARNHKVVSVELLPDREDTGDITIESPSNSHVFALACGVYVHNSTDGRGSKVETLPGGELVGEIGDLLHFSKKMARGLRIPTSYLDIGENDGGGNVTYNDGKLGAAMIQEFRFSKFCMRLQSLLSPTFDQEFKRFLLKNGIEIEWGLFSVQFTPPQSFTKYRQLELDGQRTQTYSSVAENKILSQRFKLKRYLGLTEDEIIENEKMWSEENAAKLKKKVGQSPAETTDAAAGLGDVGLHPGGDMGDLGMPPEEGMPDDAGAGMPGMGPGAAPGGPMPPGGAPPAGPAGGGGAAPGGAPPMPG